MKQLQIYFINRPKGPLMELEVEWVGIVEEVEGRGGRTRLSGEDGVDEVAEAARAHLLVRTAHIRPHLR